MCKLFRFLLLLPFILLALSLQAQVSVQGVFGNTQKKVLVAAHRGDWKNYPENSIPAVLSCIERGIDIVEIDVQKTRDGHFVLMHDATVNRTTNGRGSVSRLTLKKIQSLRLKDHMGKLTNYKVPTLDTILKITRGKILVNLDKSSGRFKELLPIISDLDCGANVILKGTGPAEFFKTCAKNDLSGTFFMPIISCRNPDLDTFITGLKPALVEFLLSRDTVRYVQPAGLAMFRQNSCRLWYNALFANIAGGHVENKDAIASWDWFISHDAYVIQTDFPFHLQTYLIQKGLYPIPEGFVASDLSALPKFIPDSIKVITKEFTPVSLPDTALKQPVYKTNKKNKESDRKYYTVKKGDTLSGIGKKYRISVADIRQMNPRLRNKTFLKIGQKLRVS